MKIGKLDVKATKHKTLGNIVEVEVPINCTDFVTSEDGVVTCTTDAPSVTIRLTLETAQELSKAFQKLYQAEMKRVQDSFCGAV